MRLPKRFYFYVALLSLCGVRAFAGSSGPVLYEEYPQPNETEEFAGYVQEITDIQKSLAKGMPIERGFHSKAHGCLTGNFEVLNDIPADAQFGVFTPGKSYPVIGRFSNASGTPKPDTARDMRGLALKLAGVNASDPTQTQDFLMTNGPVHFAKDARGMMAFAKAGTKGALAMVGYFLSNPKGALVLLKNTSHKVASMTSESYWSRTPFRIGPKAMKFNVTPCSTDPLPMPPKSPTYLTDDLRARAAAGQICFNFNIQIQLDPVKQPIEDASVEWKESDTKSITIARVIFDKQTFDSTEQLQACNDMAFNPWNHVPELRPIGNMNRARKVVYPAGQWFRGVK